MALYKLVSRHSAPGVAKKAKQMLFGFSAGAYLKAHTISCALPLLWRSPHTCTLCPAPRVPACMPLPSTTPDLQVPWGCQQMW